MPNLRPLFGTTVHPRLGRRDEFFVGSRIRRTMAQPPTASGGNYRRPGRVGSCACNSPDLQVNTIQPTTPQATRASANSTAAANCVPTPVQTLDPQPPVWLTDRCR